jgi:hypothetical protein
MKFSSTLILHGLRLNCILTQFGILQLFNFYTFNSESGATFILLPIGILKHILIYVHYFINYAAFSCFNSYAGPLRLFMLIECVGSGEKLHLI